MGEYTSATISKKRYNGLKKAAENEGRSVIGQLDWILKNAGVPEVEEAAPIPIEKKNRRAGQQWLDGNLNITTPTLHFILRLR